MSINTSIIEYLRENNIITYYIVSGLESLNHDSSINLLQKLKENNDEYESIYFVYSENDEGNSSVSLIKNFDPKTTKLKVTKSFLYGICVKGVDLDGISSLPNEFDRNAKFVSNITMINWLPSSIEDVKLKSCENNAPKTEKTNSPRLSTVPAAIIKKNNEKNAKSFFASTSSSKENLNKKSPVKATKSPTKATKIPVKVEKQEEISSQEDKNVSPLKKTVRKRAVLFDSSDEENPKDEPKEENVLVEESMLDDDEDSCKPKKKVCKSEGTKSTAKRKKNSVGEDDLDKKPDVDSKPRLTTSMLNSQNKNNKKRKLVDQTTKDSDGFLITEKVWVTDSEDNDEEQEEPKKITPPPKPVTKEEPFKLKQAEKSKPKQKNLMDFFKKN